MFRKIEKIEQSEKEKLILRVKDLVVSPWLTFSYTHGPKKQEDTNQIKYYCCQL